MTTPLRILSVTFNPALDLVGFSSHIRLGELNRIESLGLYPSGKGVNVAKVLADLAIPVTVTGFLGEDNQSDFVQLFEQNNIRDLFYRVKGKTRINVKITETDSNVTELNFQGFKIQSQDWEQFIAQSDSWYKHFDLVAICGSLPDGIEISQFSSWLSHLKSQGLKIILDTSHSALSEGIKAKPWLIKPNQKELEDLTNHALTNLDDIIYSAKILHQKGIENVIVSMGDKGAVWVNDQGILRAEPPHFEHIVSTVGAGDSMIAGLLYGFIHQWDKIKTLRFASAVSALAVTQTNVGISDELVLNNLLPKIKLTTL
ncbi:1-phosphofructokinase [Otariodibacter oris]|uniref:Phosphofructokinase n=1 Tax=Otariodibacter oris TaxID=1032623 RepID=A0A420XHH3_9PAST|nr:1-phosphofructokinase [Otariodibacter oris]QGM81231.1 1-phosphofructokinase [Otariodibacter oris]RKR72792.1 1-phosphofructokinase [Otariodibacter oris]